MIAKFISVIQKLGILYTGMDDSSKILETITGGVFGVVYLHLFRFPIYNFDLILNVKIGRCT